MNLLRLPGNASKLLWAGWGRHERTRIGNDRSFLLLAQARGRGREPAAPAVRPGRRAARPAAPPLEATPAILLHAASTEPGGGGSPTAELRATPVLFMQTPGGEPPGAGDMIAAVAGPAPVLVHPTTGEPLVSSPAAAAEAAPDSLPPAALPPGGALAEVFAPATAHEPLLDHVLATMLAALQDAADLAPVPGLPDPVLGVAEVREQAAGLGKQRGTELRGSFPVDLKAICLDARVRFLLWATGPVEAQAAMTALNARLLAARDTLRAAGFMRLDLADATLIDTVASLNGWREQVDYRVLYEYSYEDTDAAASLIARIPIQADQEVLNSPSRETTTVTDELVRWDEQAAPRLLVRGRSRVGRVAALTFIPVAPAAPVTLVRTYDGAPGPPVNHATLADFLAAVAGPQPPERHAEVRFSTLADFLAAFSAVGDPITLGDWDANSVLDTYQAHALLLVPAIELPRPVDRLELSYGDLTLDQVGVVYLRARRA